MNEVLSVSQLNRYIKDVFLRDPFLNNVWVRGEISNLKLHYSGHMYLTLKDEESTLKCVMFRSRCAGLKFKPENGTKVLVRGSVSVFERDGQYQLYVEEMQPDGIGALHIAFEQLKRKLEEEGLFDQSRKKMIPFLPGSIAVVTSKTGAVIRDILNVSGRRYPGVPIKIFPTAVQGEEAPGQIVHAIRTINRLKCADVIIVARGGGSLEDLWAFNDENVARAIAASEIPVISAVGHETDYSIADFVADLRAPTPSAAAELALPDRKELMHRVAVLANRLKLAEEGLVERKKSRLEQLKNSRSLKLPFDRVNQERMKLDIHTKVLIKNMDFVLKHAQNRFKVAVARLDSLSPLAILSRGYSIVQDEQGQVVKSSDEVRCGQVVKVTLNKGSLLTRVEEKQAPENITAFETD